MPLKYCGNYIYCVFSGVFGGVQIANIRFPYAPPRYTAFVLIISTLAVFLLKKSRHFPDLVRFEWKKVMMQKTVGDGRREEGRLL